MLRALTANHTCTSSGEGGLIIFDFETFWPLMRVSVCSVRYALYFKMPL